MRTLIPSSRRIRTPMTRESPTSATPANASRSNLTTPLLCQSAPVSAQAARYDNVNYYANPDKPIGTAGLIGYDSGYFQVYLGRSFGPQLDVQVGPYVSRYEADDDSNQTDNYGLAFDGKYTWSKIWETGLSFQVARSDTTQPQAIPPTEETTTNWGLEFYGLRKGQVTTLRYSIGHFIQPSSAASMIETNQLRSAVRPYLHTQTDLQWRPSREGIIAIGFRLREHFGFCPGGALAAVEADALVVCIGRLSLCVERFRRRRRHRVRQRRVC